MYIYTMISYSSEAADQAPRAVLPLVAVDQHRVVVRVWARKNKEGVGIAYAGKA